LDGEVLATPTRTTRMFEKLTFLKLEQSNKDDTVMAAVVPAAGVPGLILPPMPRPPPPPLPFPGDPGTFTGWLLERLASISSKALAREIEAGFAHLMASIPADPADADHPGAMRDLVNEVLNSADLC
jgi:hypothetical protein